MNTDSAHEMFPATSSHAPNSSLTTQTTPPAIAASSEDKQAEEFGLIKADLNKHLNTCRANALACHLEAAKHLHELQQELLPGEWPRLFATGSLPIGNLRTAQLWARVASNAALITPKNFPLLPTALSSLSELAGVKPGVLQAALDSGSITAESTTAQVKSFARQARGLPSVRHTEKPIPRLI